VELLLLLAELQLMLLEELTPLHVLAGEVSVSTTQPKAATACHSTRSDACFVSGAASV